MSTPGFLFKARNALRDGFRYHGVWFPFVSLHRLGTYCWRRRFGPHTFDLGGENHPYYLHPFILNNERAVEITLGLEFIRGRAGPVLEVGNVLANFSPFPHDVVDKYEKAPGVINEDIVTYSPARRYETIVSISTLEHVGWDETPRDPQKIVRAIARLKELLTDTGELLATMPLGYNPHLDELVRTGQTGFPEARYLKRITANNQWREVPWAEVAGAQFGSPFPCANALFVGYFRCASSRRELGAT